MPQNLESLWDDDNFSVETGIIPGRATLSGGEIGTGLIYYPINTNLTHRLAGTVQTIQIPQSPVPGLKLLWNTGPESEIFNPHESSSSFVRVALKPSPQVAAELPQNLLGFASAALVHADWDERFKKSVLEDLDVIHAFIEPIRSGQTPSAEIQERATLAKQDLDVKLLWSAGEYRRFGIFNLGYRSSVLAAASPGTGVINVTVNTKDPTNTALAVSGCWVWYVTRINHNKPGSYKSFSTLSTPTSEGLVAGNYDMWTGKGGRSSTKRVVSIVSASAAQFVDLLAP
jgi:hypothetical protein